MIRTSDLDDNMTNKKLTLLKCDVLKVFMMVTVIIYHCICLWLRGGWFNQAPRTPSVAFSVFASYLNTFCVYVFTFISGYLFYYLKYEIKKYKSFKTDVSKRAKRLLLPYLFASLFWVIPFNCYFFESTPTQIVNNFLLAKSPAQLWFLIMLFGVFVLFYGLSDFFEKHNFWICTIVCILIYGFGLVFSVFADNIFQTERIFGMIIYYYLGFFFRKNAQNFFYKVPWIIYFILHLLTFGISYFILYGNENIIFKLLNIAITPVCNIYYRNTYDYYRYFQI